MHIGKSVVYEYKSFNPSQVQFTPRLNPLAWVESESVSIPHRFNSHLLTVLSKRFYYFVSIPHRFNSHLGGNGLGVGEFMFQSLTGSIHTKILEKKLEKFKQFQSLTGSIHTLMGLLIAELAILVSIPHRFNSHPKVPGFFLLLQKSFNPSQVQFTRIIMSYSFKIDVVFQSLTGSIHTCLVNSLSLSIIVSIPHRFNSHEICE